jgi:hypothetical protein
MHGRRQVWPLGRSAPSPGLDLAPGVARPAQAPQILPKFWENAEDPILT